MIRIAICDDLISDAESLKMHIARYAEENGLITEAKVFCDKEDIVATLGEAEEYDVLFVDIYMETLNGIDLVRGVKDRGKNSRIVFFSTSTEHALDAFGVNAVQYLVKPVSYDALVNAMTLALADKLKREEVLNITNGSGIVKIPLDKIVCVEAQRNYQYIFLNDGMYERTRMTCAEIFDCLQDRHEFLRVGASYIVNLIYVNKIVPNEITLEGGKRIPVPRRVYGTIEKKYVDYYMEGGRI